VLASCSYDGTVVVWKEAQSNNWVKVFEDSGHKSSVNSISFAPSSYGLVLAAASGDGSVSVFSHNPQNQSWDRKSFAAHKGGANAVSWAPDVKTGALLSKANNSPQFSVSKRLVTCGCDNRVRIWAFDDSDGKWAEQNVFFNSDSTHGDWVRDVAWAPSLGLPSDTIASCSEDKTVVIWTANQNGVWRRSDTLKFDNKVWKISWSLMGNILAVSQGDNKVSTWKEALDGKWQQLSLIADEAAAKAANASSSASASASSAAAASTSEQKQA
jgi:protein transport protein SEC13